MKNQYIILILTFLWGTVLGLSFISAQSIFLIHHSAAAIIYCSVISTIILILFINYFPLKGIKHAKFTMMATLVIASGNFALAKYSFAVEIKSYIWILLSMFSIGFFNFQIQELANKYLDPARSQALMAYVPAAIGLGNIFPLGLITLLSLALSPTTILYLTCAIYCLTAIIILLTLAPKTNLEIGIGLKTNEKTKSSGNSTNDSLEKKFMAYFAAICFIIGITLVFEKYLLRLILKNNFDTFEEMNNISILLKLATSSIAIISSFTVGRMMFLKRTSPIKLIMLNKIIGLFAYGVGAIIPGIYPLLGADIVSNVANNSMGNSGISFIIQSFSAKLRKNLKTIEQFFYLLLASIAVLPILHHYDSLAGDQAIKMTLTSIFISIAIGIVLLLLFRKSFVKILFHLLEKGESLESVKAASTLSFLRPKNFEQKLQDATFARNIKSLKKTVILSLAFSKSVETHDQIIDKLNDDSEEIQLAVIDAIRISQNHKGIKYLLDIINSNSIVKSQRVRLNATHLLAALYGKRSIPLLMQLLDSDDPREWANTIEALSSFKDPQIITMLERYSSSEIPRVKANALFGLYQHRRHRKKALAIIEDCLNGNNDQEKASILYAIGRIRLKKLRPQVEGLLKKEQPASIHYPLLWALSELDSLAGIKGFAAEFLRIITEDDQKQFFAFLHFFGQMSKKNRFDIIGAFVKIARDTPEALVEASSKLNNTDYDFAQERSYLDILSARIIDK